MFLSHSSQNGKASVFSVILYGVEFSKSIENTAAQTEPMRSILYHETNTIKLVFDY